MNGGQELPGGSPLGPGDPDEALRVEAGVVAGQAPWAYGRQAEKWALRATTIMTRGGRRLVGPQPLSSLSKGRKRSSQRDTEVFVGPVPGWLPWAERCHKGPDAKVWTQRVTSQ